ncbi:MAG: 23S rRNA (uracil(1939)-C(5))-methyltransferase RlmD [Eubacteriales bacterium]|nr:23S rRNA (uracil(1939)-C(5))-methyltransferase RlmD [Eubacteriales bacterium]
MNEYNKNTNITLKIVDMTNDGLGIAKEGFKTFFVKNGIVGDVIDGIITKVNKNIIYVKAINIITKSPYRIEPKCEFCKQCGGCTLQEIDYDKELQIKKEAVQRNLIRIGKVEYNEDIIKNNIEIIGMENPYFYRNKMQMPFSINKEGNTICGFYAKRTHNIIQINNCNICFDEASIIMNIIKKWCDEEKIQGYDENKKIGLLRHVLIRKGFKTGEIGICLIINDNTYPKILVSKIFNLLRELKSYNITSFDINLNMNRDNVILSKKIINIKGNGYINDEMTIKNTNLNFKISTKAFYQVNFRQAKKLYEIIIEYIEEIEKNNNKKIDVALDLYCGIGTITLFISKYVEKVVGVEIVEEAIIDAKENARINGINNAFFYAHDLSLCDLNNICTNSINKNEKIELVIVDPPRKGLEKNVIDNICEINTKNIIYVSCDSATLSRDIKLFYDRGYILQKIKLVDMFPRTMHVETVCLLTRV